MSGCIKILKIIKMKLKDLICIEQNLDYIHNLNKMITFKKTFDYYATDGELDVFVNNIFDTIIDDPEADVEVYADSDTDYRYITVNILDKVLH